jgi:hypothetical protein
MPKERKVTLEVHAPAPTLHPQLKDDHLVVRVVNTMEFAVGGYIKKKDLQKLIESTDIEVVQTGVWGTRR